MQVSKSGRFVYINPPRTGTTKIWDAARSAFPDLWQPAERGRRHSTIWNDEWEDFFIFVTVRHPYTRAVSLWHRWVDYIVNRGPKMSKLLKHGNITFSDMVCHKDPFLMRTLRNHCCLHYTELAPRIDHVLHLETLLKDWPKLVEAVPAFKSLNLRHRVNASKSPKAKIPWHEHYSEHAIELIEKAFARDFDAYGYNRNFDQVREGKVFA